MIAGMKNAVPRRSNSFMRSLHGRTATASLSGALKKIKMTRTVTKKLNN